MAFGPRVETDAPGAGRVLVNGEEPSTDAAPAHTGAHLEDMVEAVRRRLAAVGRATSRPGERIITGILAPPHAAQPGDVVRLELDALGAVELRFALNFAA